MPTAIDLTGRVFGRLTVVCFAGSRPDVAGKKRRMYVVRCECGTEKELEGIRLIGGNTKLCGCLKADHQRTGSVTHGHATSGAWSPEYRTWQSMLRRCLTPGASGFKKYGAKGVTVCPAWQESFETFLRDMGPKPSPMHSIDRIDNARGYEPTNCRWATRIEQARNKTSNHVLTIAGESMPVAAWSERSGTPATLIILRVRRGWSPADAVFRPVMDGGSRFRPEAIDVARAWARDRGQP